MHRGLVVLGGSACGLLLLVAVSLRARRSRGVREDELAGEAKADKPLEVRVRTMSPSDDARVRQLWRDGLSQTVEATPQWWAAFKLRCKFWWYARTELAEGGTMSRPAETWAREHAHAWVAVHGHGATERVVGCVMAKRGRGSDLEAISGKEDVVSLLRMSVCREARRMGVGRQLVDAVVTWAKGQQGVTRIVLVTVNPWAAQFYQQLGWKPEDDTKPAFMHRELR
jgi:GNAT superfamily N-acetyltransferase